MLHHHVPFECTCVSLHVRSRSKMASMSPVSHCLACGEITQRKDRRILGSVSDKTSPGYMQKVPLWIYVIIYVRI